MTLTDPGAAGPAAPASGDTASGGDDGGDGAAATPGKRRWPIALIAIVAGTVAYWAWIFAGANLSGNPDSLKAHSWVAGAERTCAATRKQLARLPKAEVTRSNEARADVIAQANTELAAMLDRLGAAPPAGDDGRVVRLWLTDYRTYLADRTEYVGRLRRDAQARFLLSPKGTQPVDGVVDDFALLNHMASCATPGDVG